MSSFQHVLNSLVNRVNAHAKWIPWISLVAGVAGALLMERSPKTSVIVFVAALFGWLAVFGLGFVTKPENEETKQKAARLFVIWMTQNLMQQCLFFVLPFYVMSSSWISGHIVFNGVLIAICLLSLWDPIFEAMVNTAERRVALQTFVIFVTLHAIGPFLGLSNRSSLYLASIAAALGAPLLIFRYLSPTHRLKKALGAFAVTAFAFVGFAILGAPLLLPPAPLKMVDGGIGTGYKSHSLIGAAKRFEKTPESLVCSSAVKAPVSTKDTLIHVWSFNGKETDKIPLKIKGGREAGFRTYSRKKRLQIGLVTCRVETPSGQIVGSYSVHVGSSTPAALVAQSDKR